MKRISKNIAIALLGILVWTSSEETYAQCKVDPSDPVKGEFSINNVSVKGDGGGINTASNNIPIKVCEGELITLKSTLPVTSVAVVGYWITPFSNYNSLSSPPSNIINAADSYNTLTGNVQIKMIDKATDGRGFSAYATAGKYVITQYDNSNAQAGGPGFHHACQVIEIIKPTKPDVQYNNCSGGKLIFNFPANANNTYDNYTIKYLLSNSYKPEDKTGKPANYPFTFQSITDLSSYGSVSIEVKGESATGGCSAPAFTIPSFSLNNNVVNKPSLNALIGTTVKGEFKLAVSADNGVKRNIYVRDPAVDNFFNYATPFKSYSSSAASGLDSNSVQVPNGDKTYCFQVEAVDASCSTSFVSNPALRSDELCTTLINVVPLNKKNVITWSQALGVGGGLIGANFVNYIIERYRSDGTFDKVLKSTPNASETTFTDSDVICGQEYVYKVTTRYPLKSISQAVKVKATSTDIPPKISRVFATISNTGINVRVQGQFNVGAVPVNIKPNAYKFYRAEGLAGNYTLLKSGNSSIDDITANVDEKSYCYYMTWTNLCENESDPSDKVCTVYLKAEGSTLKWTAETSLSVGTDSYFIQLVNPATKTNIKVLKDNLIGTQTFDTKALGEEEGQELFIQIESRPVGWNTTDPNVSPSTLSNIIRVFRPSFLLAPQIFTPNGDGNNDKFLVRGKFIKKLKMTIYDRWGNVIYYEDTDNFPLQKDQTDTNVVGWNGIMNNGNRAIEGSYVYKVEIEDFIGQVTYKEGALLLAY